MSECAGFQQKDPPDSSGVQDLVQLRLQLGETLVLLPQRFDLLLLVLEPLGVALLQLGVVPLQPGGLFLGFDGPTLRTGFALQCRN